MPRALTRSESAIEADREWLADRRRRRHAGETRGEEVRRLAAARAQAVMPGARGGRCGPSRQGAGRNAEPWGRGSAIVSVGSMAGRRGPMRRGSCVFSTCSWAGKSSARSSSIERSGSCRPSPSGRSWACWTCCPASAASPGAANPEQSRTKARKATKTRKGMTNCTGGHGRCPAKVIDAVWRRVLLALNLFGGFRAPGTLMAVGRSAEERQTGRTGSGRPPYRSRYRLVSMGGFEGSCTLALDVPANNAA
jgi:hypothetical protein